MLALTSVINYSNIDGITGFSEEDSQSVLKFMQSAVELAKSNGLVSVHNFSFSNNLSTRNNAFVLISFHLMFNS